MPQSPNRPMICVVIDETWRDGGRRKPKASGVLPPRIGRSGLQRTDAGRNGRGLAYRLSAPPTRTPALPMFTAWTFPPNTSFDTTVRNSFPWFTTTSCRVICVPSEY